MRYHHEIKPYQGNGFGDLHKCNHPVYNECTLFKIGEIGLAVIQQYWNEDDKYAYWGPMDVSLSRDIYLHPEFLRIFRERADEPVGDIYPTVTVRQLMWSLKMKPLRKERWETMFDRKLV